MRAIPHGPKRGTSTCQSSHPHRSPSIGKTKEEKGGGSSFSPWNDQETDLFQIGFLPVLNSHRTGVQWTKLNFEAFFLKKKLKIYLPKGSPPKH